MATSRDDEDVLMKAATGNASCKKERKAETGLCPQRSTIRYSGSTSTPRSGNRWVMASSSSASKRTSNPNSQLPSSRFSRR